MKSIVCPICKQKILSESFQPGDNFACPHCRHELTVDEFQEDPIARSSLDFVDKIGWTSGIWKGGLLHLSKEHLQFLGEFMVSVMEMDQWPEDSMAKLEKRLAKAEKVRAYLKAQGMKEEIYSLNKTLLSVFISLREQKKI